MRTSWCSDEAGGSRTTRMFAAMTAATEAKVPTASWKQGHCDRQLHPRTGVQPTVFEMVTTLTSPTTESLSGRETTLGTEMQGGSDIWQCNRIDIESTHNLTKGKLPYGHTLGVGSVELPATRGRLITSASHLGLFRRCGYPAYQPNGDVEWIQGCGYYPALESVPHWVWRLALVLLIIAICLLVCLAFFVICSAACMSLLQKDLKMSRACSYVHLVAGEIVLCAIRKGDW
ncbi:unnamed protein product [Hydatigera taeniaeformis]|uniref:Lipoma HMGIC fusion partner n=1 Tax=Hydatigena taeniaeformis TaxID=6205 RepID=A0A0R3X3F1_HYDTA|nr:unnamed protein product [Hydatigera taeniaeformis]